MAGTSDPTKSPWPHGEKATKLIKLGPVSMSGDSAGYLKVASHKAQYDFNIKRARMFIREGSVSISGGILLKLLDDSASPLTIVAARAITAADDAGVWVDLTVADEGPILTGALLLLSIDSNTSDTAEDVMLELDVEPIYG